MLICLSVFQLQAELKDPGIEVVSVQTYAKDRIYFMSAVIETKLPDYITLAVQNGLPLPLIIQIEVLNPNSWWFDESMVLVEQRYQIHYLPLLDAVQLENINAGSNSTYSSIEHALEKIGVIIDYPLLDREHFILADDTYARIRMKIDIDSLPKPLRTQTILGGSWNIKSDWKEWVLK